VSKESREAFKREMEEKAKKYLDIYHECRMAGSDPIYDDDLTRIKEDAKARALMHWATRFYSDAAAALPDPGEYVKTRVILEDRCAIQAQTVLGLIALLSKETADRCMLYSDNLTLREEWIEMREELAQLITKLSRADVNTYGEELNLSSIKKRWAL